MIKDEKKKKFNKRDIDKLRKLKHKQVDSNELIKK